MNGGIDDGRMHDDGVDEDGCWCLLILSVLLFSLRWYGGGVGEYL
jgi:hypothetical protein